MIVIDIDPVLLYINGTPLIRWYGVMFVVGILVAVTVAIKFGEEKGLSEDDFWTIFWPATIVGLIGSRLYFVAQQPDLVEGYLLQPLRILATWEGGLAFYGAIFGAALAILVVCYLRRLSIWSVLDVGAVFAVVGQTFGRIGNMINGDVVGYPTTLPWGFVYAHPNSFVADRALPLHGTMPLPIGTIPPDVTSSLGLTAYQPASVYEFCFNIALFAFLWLIRGRVKTPGLLFVIWLVLYSLGQFALFFARDNVVLYLGLKQAQLTAIAVIVACIPLAWYLLGRRSDVDEPEGAEAETSEEAELPESGATGSPGAS